MKRIFLAVALLLAGTAHAKDTAPPPPSPQPDFAKVRKTAESGLVQGYFDPGSIQIFYFSGFQWGFAKPIIGRRTWGWIACGTINAKNRMGGYVGAQPFWIMSDAAGTISWAMTAQTISSCDNGQKAVLQPALQDTPTTTLSGNGQVGIAEELEKLAGLRDKGIITQAEFDAQKAKLLNR